jgi:hypothetical protein
MNKPAFGDGEIQLARWETPFENARFWVLGVSYEERTLIIHVQVCASDGVPLSPEPIYPLRFDEVDAFRVFDEGGLPPMPNRTSETGERTFRLRNHP